ncbi:hypothetical protein pb186bvf_000288 [Paramecium bursaria]
MKLQTKFPEWGSVLGAPFGVASYSNYGFRYDHNKVLDYKSFLKKEESGFARDVYLGFRFQCVEYARRFLVHSQKVFFIDVPCAYHIWELDTVEDVNSENGQFPFINFPQGSTHPPQIGDLVIYHKSSEQRFGHVAVITNVNFNEMYFDIAEQNYEEEGWETQEYSRRLVLEKNQKNEYYLTNKRYGQPDNLWDRYETFFGWKRVIKN